MARVCTFSCHENERRSDDSRRDPDERRSDPDRRFSERMTRAFSVPNPIPISLDSTMMSVTGKLFPSIVIELPLANRARISAFTKRFHRSTLSHARLFVTSVPLCGYEPEYVTTRTSHIFPF